MSGRSLARIAGVIYLIPTAPFAELYVRGGLIVPGDPAATANKILANEQLWRLGGVADLVLVVQDATLALVFYVLFAPVSRHVSLLAAFFRLSHVAVMASTVVLHFAPLAYLSTANPQLQTQAYAALRMHTIGYNVALFFFGFHCITLGFLAVRSGFMPRILGILLASAGVGYLVNAVVHLLAPAYTPVVFRYVTVPCGMGELLFVLWLLVFGVKDSASAGSRPPALAQQSTAVEE